MKGTKERAVPIRQQHTQIMFFQLSTSVSLTVKTNVYNLHNNLKLYL